MAIPTSHGGWAAWRRRTAFDHVPDSFESALDTEIRFADLALTREIHGQVWGPSTSRWK